MRIELVRTCYACPEQYDVLIDDEQAAYMRLRNGRFSVECPDAGGTEVYAARPDGDGIFDADERAHFIGEAMSAIIAYHGASDD